MKAHLRDTGRHNPAHRAVERDDCVSFGTAQTRMSTRWRIELLGGLRACSDAAEIDRFRTQKTGSLLAYLAFHMGRAHSREMLTEQMWPEDPPVAARHKLSVALSSLRQQLEPTGVADSSVLVADRLTVRLNPAAVVTDVGEFEAFLRNAQQAKESERDQWLRKAVNLYVGPLLPGFYEDWIIPEQRRLEALYFEAVRRLLPLLKSADGESEALQVAIRAVAVDRLREESHRLLIGLYAASGQRDAALRQYEELKRLLKEELGAAPAAETERLARQIVGRSAYLDGLPAVESETLIIEDATPAATKSGSPPVAPEDLDPAGGAVPLDSAFYIMRAVDAEMARGISRRVSIVLLKGPGQVGKTSLLARALQTARASGARAVYTNLQLLNAEQLGSAELLLQAIARSISEQLGYGGSVAASWDAEDGPNMNFRRFMRGTIQQDPGTPLVWAVDDIDRLFTCPFGSEIFALLRAWHNERALDPAGPWSWLTLAIAYASEAHLFITDVNQSPFNVGTRLTMEDFTFDQVADLNRRYAAPLRDQSEIGLFLRLVGGHPYLVRRGLQEMSSRGLRLAVVEAQADREDWVYGDHLRRLRTLLHRDSEYLEAMRDLLRSGKLPNPASFYQLRSAGLVAGDTWVDARPRCQLYTRYLEPYLLQRS